MELPGSKSLQIVGGTAWAVWQGAGGGRVVNCQDSALSWLSGVKKDTSPKPSASHTVYPFCQGDTGKAGKKLTLLCKHHGLCATGGAQQKSRSLIRVHHSFFSWCHCPCVIPFCLIFSCWHSFQPPPWLARVCSSSVSLCCALPGASCLAVINCTEQCFPGCLHL